MHEEGLNRTAPWGGTHQEGAGGPAVPSAWGLAIKPSSNSGVKSFLLSFLPINLVFKKKRKHQTVSSQVMSSFWIHRVTEDSKTTEAAAKEHRRS